MQDPHAHPTHSDESFRELVELTPAILWRAGATSFDFTYVSPQAEILLGYPVGRWLNEPGFWEQHIYPPDREETVRCCLAATAAGESHELTYRMVAASGKLVWLHDIVHVRVIDGTPIEVFGIMIDITAQKEAEEGLHERQEQLQLALDAVQMGIWVWEIEDNRVIWSPEVAVIFGIDEAGFQGSYAAYMACVHPEDRARLEGRLTKAIQQDEAYEVIHRIVWPDASVRWVKCRGRVYRDENGRPLRMTGTVVDVTKRREADEARRTENAFRKAIIQRVAEGICVCHATDTYPFVRFTVWNEQMTRITGYTMEGINRLGWYQTLYPDEAIRAQAIQRMSEMREGHDLLAEEWTIRHADGRARVISISTTVMPSANGEPQVLAAIRDITRSKEYERELQAAKEKAEVMNDLKSAFLANMSHEIRTPLTSIIGFAGLLEEENLGQPAEDFAQMITQSGRRLLETLNAVLDLSQLEAGAMALYPQPVDVAVEVRGAVDMVRPLLQDQEINLTLEGLETEAEAIADPNALQRIILNLLNNAIKFSDQGGSIRVSLVPKEDHLVLEIEDTGVGIAPDFIPHLFDAFKQESAGIQRDYEGSGLGLAITKQLIDLMGGTIGVESAKNVGTRFTITLPQKAQQTTKVDAPANTHL